MTTHPQSLPSCLSGLVKAHTRGPCWLFNSDTTHGAPETPGSFVARNGLGGIPDDGGKRAKLHLAPLPGMGQETEVLLGARMSLTQIGSSLQEMETLPAR